MTSRSKLAICTHTPGFRPVDKKKFLYGDVGILSCQAIQVGEWSDFEVTIRFIRLKVCQISRLAGYSDICKTIKASIGVFMS